MSTDIILSGHMRSAKHMFDTLGVNFINILRKAFMHADTKSEKNWVKLSVFFALLGSAHVKTSCKMLV